MHLPKYNTQNRTNNVMSVVRSQVSRMTLWAVVLLLITVTGMNAHATQIQDLTTIEGEVSGKLVGMGLVVGLDGTGDGDRFAQAQRALAQMSKQLMGDDTINAMELADARNAAIVYIEAKIPEDGASEGQNIDITVASYGRAQSLAGGLLLMTPLLPPTPAGGRTNVLAYASGKISMPDPENAPNTAEIKGGAELNRGFSTRYLTAEGQIILSLNEPYSSWTMANLLAQMINSEVSLSPDRPVARALGPKRIAVTVPTFELRNPRGLSPFIDRIQQINVPMEAVRTEARVTINERTGTITIGGDVRLNPVSISHKNLEITIMEPEQVPNEINPQERTERFVELSQDNIDDPAKANIQDLVNAFNKLAVPMPDRIAIIRQLWRQGDLHAQLIEE